MHVRTRPPRFAPSGGVCNRPRRRPGSDAQSPSSPNSLDAPAELFRSAAASTSGFVSHWGHSRRRWTVVQRFGERPRPTDVAHHCDTRSGRRLIAAVQWYQRAFADRPSPCRFTPSCSCYAVEALDVHGAGRGLWLTVRRLLRCRPFGPSGFDPVPERASAVPGSFVPDPTDQKGV